MMGERALGSTHNPFCSADALRHSAYSAWTDGKLVHVLDSRRTTPDAELAHLAVRAALLHPASPCVGAKAAVNRGTLRTAHYARLADRAVTAGLARDLYAFDAEYTAAGDRFASFVATFAAPAQHTQAAFEADLWSQLRLLNELDAPHHRWDPAVSADPSDPDFAFSFGGSAFFVVGMHPHSERFARRLPFAALAFNPRRQFDRLRAEGGFARMQAVIRRADIALQGSLNPMLEGAGISEARQYAGGAVDAAWRCPFAAEEP